MHLRRLAVILLLSAMVPVAGALASDETAWLGVQLGGSRSVGPEDAPTATGVVLSRIFADSPAAESGLRAQDIVLSVGGSPVGTRGELIERIREQEPGSWVPMSVWRQGRELDIRARLETRPDNPGSQRLRQGWIGAKGIDLPATLREHFGAPEDAGVMISAIVAESTAEVAGLEIGDVVYEMDGEPVRSSGDLARKLASAGVGNKAELVLTRWGNTLEIDVVVDEAPAPRKKSERP